uniref:Uncharacterized protein n=1 Tax=Chlamydomonas leiostraca TaxID=1034604 RepID=A0A7S0S616_9CHLO
MVRQLVRCALAPQADLVPDLVQARSESLAGMLTGGIKGLGRFGLPTGLLGAMAGAVAGASSGPRPMRPAECDVVLVFVVGGISCAELREARQELETLHGMQTAEDDSNAQAVRVPQLILGGTSLLSPVDVVRSLL